MTDRCAAQGNHRELAPAFRLLETRLPMITSRPLFPTLAAAVAIAMLSGCGGGEDSSGVNTSTLSINITDAPVAPVTKVWVQFTGIEIKPLNGAPQTFSFSPAKGYDLLTLQNGNAAPLLGDTTVAAGPYEWVRLMIDPAPGSSYLIDATGQHDLRIPS